MTEVPFPIHDFPLDGIPITEDAGRKDLNPQGYDTGPFEERGLLGILSLGCSWTQGSSTIGAFPNYACDEISSHFAGVKVKSWNMGLGGRSVDYMARSLLCVIDYLNPDAVILCFPSPDRFEYFRENSARIKYQIDWIGEEERNGGNWRRLDEDGRNCVRRINQLTNCYNDSIRFLKDFKLIEETLAIRKIPFVFTCVPVPSLVSTLEEFMEMQWLPRERYLGVPFVPIDFVSETDSHPGMGSHKAFGKAIAEWLLERHSEEFSSKIRQRTPA